MSETSEGLSLLAEEAARVRALRPGIRIQWSDDFRKQVASLVTQGVTISELAHAVKVGSSTVWEWCRRQNAPSFSELKVVPQRKTKDSVTLTTRRGHVLVLSWSELRSLFQEGML